MNVVRNAVYVTGDTVTPVFTAPINMIVNINVVNSGKTPVLVSLYISNTTPVSIEYIIDSEQILEVSSSTLLRCGEPILKDETIYVKLAPAIPPEEGEELNYGVSVRTSGIANEIVITE